MIRRARRSSTGVVSTQVLQEYFSVTTRKLGVPTEVARGKVTFFARFDVVLIDPQLIFDAIDLHRLHQVSFWDALIIRAAQKAKCRVLYSEDLQHEQKFEKLQVLNPFVNEENDDSGEN